MIFSKIITEQYFAEKVVMQTTEDHFDILLPIKCNEEFSHQVSESDTVISGLLGHNAHAVVVSGLGELANDGPLSPMSLFWIIDQHFIVFLSVSNRIFSPCYKYDHLSMMQ